MYMFFLFHRIIIFGLPSFWFALFVANKKKKFIQLKSNDQTNDRCSKNINFSTLLHHITYMTRADAIDEMVRKLELCIWPRQRERKPNIQPFSREYEWSSCVLWMDMDGEMDRWIDVIHIHLRNGITAKKSEEKKEWKTIQ